MNSPAKHIDDLIASYLAGEATADEVAFVDEWKNASDANVRYFEQMQLIFQSAASLPPGRFDTDAAWQRLRQKLPVAGGRNVRFRPNSHSVNSFLRIAASVLLLVAAGIFAYQYIGRDSIESMRVLSDTQTERDTLPDGSGVFLNRQTKIEYSFNKREQTHIAKLTGEAYFNINHDDDKIFIVEAEGTFIKDIGTSFNVKAYPDSHTIEVVVEEGEVMFYSKNDSGIYLKAHGKGVYNKDTGKFTVAEPEANVTAYKTKFFSFSGHSLQTVVETLNGVYSTRIEIDENLKDCRLTVSFNEETIEEIAQVIAETLGLSVSRSGNVIRLTGQGCADPLPQ